MLGEKSGGFVRNVEIDAIQPALFHLEVDRPGDDVARCEFAARVVVRHEAVPSGSSRRPPSPRTASEIRKDFACGW
jgi:hypothetical protein